MKAIKKGSDDESAKAKRKPQSKQQKGETQRHSASSGMRKRHSKAMRAPRRHARREVGFGMRLPADHDEIAGEVAEQSVALDLRVLCGPGHAEARVPVRGSAERAPCGLNARLPDAHVAASVSRARS